MINEAKGSMGMFSRAGKISSSMNMILAKKEEIISNKPKKKIIDKYEKNFNDIKREEVKLNDIVVSDIFSELIGSNTKKHTRSLSAAPIKKVKKPLTLEEKNAIERIQKRQNNIKKARRKVC